jgi:hypothetical protein
MIEEQKDDNIEELLENPEFSTFLENTPQKTIDFIFSEEMSNKIADICVKSGVSEEDKIEKIAYRATLALLGQLPKEKLASLFISELQIAEEASKKIADEINAFIAPFIIKSETDTTTTEPKEEKPKKSPSKDTYREPIE